MLRNKSGPMNIIRSKKTKNMERKDIIIYCLANGVNKRKPLTIF